MTTFDTLGLSDEILKVIKELGFERPSEIQEQAIPKLLATDTDFIGLAQTGTGKTAAFGLPLLERVDPADKYTQGLILAPTRELGRQIAEQLAIFSKYQKRVSVLPVYGGASIMGQIKDLKKTQHIIIATPGRLIDLIKRKAIKLDRLKYLVLDEADEMLNMGFKEELDKIINYTPAEKKTWLFSATMPKEINKIVKKYMDNPIEVRLNTKATVNKDIVHQYVIVKQSNRLEGLIRFMDIDAEMRGVVFCRTKRETQNVAEDLLKRNYKADALHGDLSQAQRDRVMKRFKNHELQVLVATDVAARGIDVNDLTHVFHFNIPDDISYYTHRSGRTARAGKKGLSIVFINSRESRKIEMVANRLSINFERVMIPQIEAIAEKRIESWCNTLLELKTKNKYDEELFNKVKMHFGNLTKEELIAKILTSELKKLNLSGSKDINESAKSGGGGGSSRGDRWGRGGRRSKGGSRDRRSGGSRSKSSSARGGGGKSGKSNEEKREGSRDNARKIKREKFKSRKRANNKNKGKPKRKVGGKPRKF